MKQIRGFGYVGNDEPREDEFEFDEVELEHGFASERAEEERTVQAYSCSRCKRVLFEADVSLHGVIFIKCPKCKREVAIETTPLMQRIGFIKPLRKEKKS